MPHVKSLATAISAIATMAFAGPAQAQSVDFWAQDMRLFAAASGNTLIGDDIESQRGRAYAPRGLELDPFDKRFGDTSFRLNTARARRPDRFGFVAGLWGETWNVSPSHTLKFEMRLPQARGGEESTYVIGLVDSQRRLALGKFSISGRAWQSMELALDQFMAPEDFDWSNIAALQFELAGLDPHILLLDGFRFERGNQVLSVTDKPLAQRVAEAEASKAQRIEYAFAEEAKRTIEVQPGPGVDTSPMSAFAKFHAGVDLDNANRILESSLNRNSKDTTWSLLHTPLYIRFYFMFSNSHGRFPGRMSEANEKLLLEVLWERTHEKNDIALTRQSTWWMHGSENHDLNAKASSLASSLIFMNEPDYADRVYPNYGFGGGAYYGRAGYYGPGVDSRQRHGGGRANLSDGRSYTAKDHHAAWVAFFKDYFRERAERGFLLEYGSPGYSKHSLGFIDLVQHYSGDPELEAMVDDFMTMFWADWAQTSIRGVRGGPKTRHHGDVGGPRDSQTAHLIEVMMGDVPEIGPFDYWNLLHDYNLPPIVWRMALDRSGMGAFSYRARGIGEEENVWPRPEGNERGMLVDTESRFLKSTYVTPLYTLGTQMDHPAAVHSHLSMAGRWHGMTVAGAPRVRVVPVGLPKEPDDRGRQQDISLELMWQTVHSGRSMILQRATRWFAVHPTWFPAITDADRYPSGVWIGDEWDARVERDGWLFLRERDVYSAIRVAGWDKTRDDAARLPNTGNQVFFVRWDDETPVQMCDPCYTWALDGKAIELDDPEAPIVIEAGDKGTYGTFEAFQQDVLDNSLVLYRAVVPGFHEVVYTGSGEGARELVFNAGAPSIPRIGGEHVDYSLPKTFDSPFLNADYNSGTVTLSYDNDELVLDFTE